MRILFYEDPLTDHHTFGWRRPHVLLDAPWAMQLVADGVDARMLLHEHFATDARKAGLGEDRLFVVSEATVQAALPDPQLNVNALFHRFYGALTGLASLEYGSEYARAVHVRGVLASVISAALGSFVPDVVVTWAPAAHLRQLFPEALILHKETGMFARPPFPTSYTLDPLGFHRWSYPRRFPHHAGPAGLVALGGLRPTLDAAMAASDRWFDYDEFRADYAGTVFVPAQFSGSFLFDAACAYRSQVHMILDVLERVPRDWAVIANDHPDAVKLTPWELEYLSASHPNFHFRSAASGIIGQQIARRADVVASVSSSIGLQALLWNRPLVALGESHLSAFTALTAADLPSLQSGATSEEGAAAWLSFHYCYQNGLAGRPGFLAGFLAGRLDHWRRQGVAGYFDEPWDDPTRIAAFISDFATTDARARFGPTEPSTSWSLALDRLDPFGRGWGVPESGGIGSYRWIDGRAADLTLLLEPDKAQSVSVQVGSPAGLVGQVASLVADERVLDAVAVPLDGSARLQAVLPPSPDGFHRLQVRAARTLRFPWESRDLSLLVSSIDVAPAPANPAIRTDHAPPRHSVAVPVLNSLETLTITLPKLLAALPDNAEIVVSDNCSDDGTWDLLHAFDDPRLKRIRTPERLDYASNAEAAYRAARGTWLSHIGDDDLIMPSRFALIDHLDAVADVEMIFGSRLRYYWPEFPDVSVANTVDPAGFGRPTLLQEGGQVARHLINSSNIRHTGAVVVKASVIDRLREVQGCFMPPRLGEYAGYRLAAGHAGTVAFLDLPIVVIGRHEKSIGTALFHPKVQETKYGRSLDREIGRVHARTGFDYLGFMAFSFEAALLAAERLEPRLGAAEIDYRLWRDRLVADVNGARVLGRLSAAEAEAVVRAGEAHLAPLIAGQRESPPRGTPVAAEPPRWGWTERLAGPALGVADIGGLLDWVETRYATELTPDGLEVMPVTHAVAVDWVDA